MTKIHSKIGHYARAIESFALIEEEISEVVRPYIEELVFGCVKEPKPLTTYSQATQEEADKPEATNRTFSNDAVNSLS